MTIDRKIKSKTRNPQPAVKGSRRQVAPLMRVRAKAVMATNVSSTNIDVAAPNGDANHLLNRNRLVDAM